MLWLRPCVCTKPLKSTEKMKSGEPLREAKRFIMSCGTLCASSPQPPIAASPVGINRAEKTTIRTPCRASLTAAAAIPPITM